MDPVTATPEVITTLPSLSSILHPNGLLLILFVLPLLGSFFLKIVAKWSILEKAGESGWAALIPFYGNYCFYDITWDNGWISLASYIPGVSYVLDVITKVKLSCRFEKNSIFTLGLVLFEPVFLAILGFDESEYSA